MKLTSTAIICTRNRAHDIVHCLASLAQQTTPFTQIIVVDSSLSSLQKDASFTNLFTKQTFGETQLNYFHTSPGLTYQRNYGIDRAQGDIIYFFDDDATAAPDYVRQMQDAFDRHPECVGGMGTIARCALKQSRVSYFAHRLFGFHGPRYSGTFTWAGLTARAYGAKAFKHVESLNGCGAYRREILKKYRFDEQLPGRGAFEDGDISWRISRQHKLFFLPAAKLDHIPSADDRQDDRYCYKEFMRNYTYLFFKNVYPRSRWCIFAYAWAVLGYYLYALRERNIEKCRGYTIGLYEYARWGIKDRR